MSHSDEHPDTPSVLRAYFKELDAALSGLPRAKRKQLTSEIGMHVDEALAEQPPGSEAELRNLLDRVGRPEDIASAALDEEPERARPPMRTWQKALIAGAGVVVLAGAGTGIGLAVSSGKTPARSPAAAGVPTAQHTATSPSASSGSPTPTPTRQAAAQPSTAPGTQPAAPSAGASTASASADSGAAADLAVLAPAAVPPVSAECAEQLTYGADGNISPLTCANGGVNTPAWHILAYGESGTTLNSSELLRLGRYANPTQVYQAMCYDYANVYKTKPITESAEEIAQAYYGWVFGVDPVQNFETSGCPAS
jgi:hypothetical protein